MRNRIRFVLALAALLAVACQDTPMNPVEQPVATAPEFNFMNGPPEPGIVVREEGSWMLFDIFDENPTEEPWMVYMGYGVNDYHPTCGGDGPSHPWSTQSIASKQGQQIILNEVNHGAGVTVFPFFEWLGHYLDAPEGVVPVWWASCHTTRIAGGTAVMHSSETPAGWSNVVNGTVEWMGDTYKLQFRVFFFGKDGFRRTARIW